MPGLRSHSDGSFSRWMKPECRGDRPMPDDAICQGCGGTLPHNAPHGLCPKCLMRVALEGETSRPDDTSGTGGLGDGPGPEGPGLPREFGGFTLIRPIGRRGMGIVYEAVDRATGERVALKILPSEAAVEPRLRARFRRGAEAVQMLGHPH